MVVPAPTMTSTTGIKIKSRNPNAAGFTLVELILVMGLLTTIMALAVPSLAHSFRRRNLEQEAVRFVAVTEYARNEAVSEGIPTTVWIEPDSGRFGVDASAGYVMGNAQRKEFSLGAELHFDLAASGEAQTGRVTPIQFDPDGTPAVDNVETIQILDRSMASVSVAQTADSWGYELLKEGSLAPQHK